MPVLVTARVAVPSKVTAPLRVKLLLPAMTAVVLGMLIALAIVSLYRALRVPPAKVTVPLPRALLCADDQRAADEIGAAAVGVGVVQGHGGGVRAPG